jgi:hypothetical protein
VQAPPARTWPEVERRGPNRATNVARIAARPAAPAPAVPVPPEVPGAATGSLRPPPKTGTDDDWTEF